MNLAQSCPINQLNQQQKPNYLLQKPNYLLQKPNYLSQVPLKFKAIILKSLYDKHRGKEVKCLKEAFFMWYIQKNDNQLIKDHVDRMLISQNAVKFTASRFFYRMKFLIRKQQQVQIDQTSHENQHDSNQQQGKGKISNSQIKQSETCAKKNFTDYFESLKNIFSMKVLQCEKQLLSDSLINDSSHQKENERVQRFKTEGCEVGVYVDESFHGLTNSETVRKEEEMVRKEKELELERKETQIMRKYGEMEQKQQEFERHFSEKVNDVKLLGKKVGYTLLKSFVSNKQRQSLWQAFAAISKHSEQGRLNETSEPTHLKQLQLTSKQSSQIHIQAEHIASTASSMSFLESSRTSLSSLPPLSHINNQIVHVEYSIGLLAQTIKKDDDLQQLYKQFQAQFGDFQAIEKDFQMLRVKTRNSLFDRLITVQKGHQKWLLNQAFTLINSSKKRKTNKSITSNISRSRVNIQTLHQVLSRSLISLQSQVNTKQDYHSQAQYQMTSIKMICQKNSNTDINFYKPQVRGGIKKQINKAETSSNYEFSLRMGSSGGENVWKEKPTACTENGASLCNENGKTHVNFVLPFGQKSSECSSEAKNSQNSLGSMREGFRKKQQHQMNSTGFYELSMKSFDSDTESPSKLYHTQLKTQYWWNDLQEKENLVLRDGKSNKPEACVDEV